MLSSGLRCDQTYDFQRYDFSHTLLYNLSQTYMLNKAALKFVKPGKWVKYETFARFLQLQVSGGKMLNQYFYFVEKKFFCSFAADELLRKITSITQFLLDREMKMKHLFLVF